MRYIYDVMVNEEIGINGLRLRNLSNAEAMGVLTAVHDLFEHVNGEITTDAEAKALGNVLYCRAEGGYFNDVDRDIGDVISVDISRLYEQRSIWGELSNPGITTPIHEEGEEWIQSAISKAIAELKYCDLTPHNKWGGWVRGWLRKGYRQAKKRYSSDPIYISQAFKNMEKEMNRAFQYAEVGSVIEVKFVRKTLKFDVRLIDIWESDHPDYNGEW